MPWENRLDAWVIHRVIQSLTVTYCIYPTRGLRCLVLVIYSWKSDRLSLFAAILHLEKWNGDVQSCCSWLLVWHFIQFGGHIYDCSSVKVSTCIWRCSVYNNTKKIGSALISVRPITCNKYRRRNNWIHMVSPVCLQWIIILCNNVLLSALLFTYIIYIFCIVNAFHSWMSSHFYDVCYPS